MIGIDLLGLGSRAVKIGEVVELWRPGFALGFFDNTWPHAFGDPLPSARKIVGTGKCPAIRVQLWWSYLHKIVPLRTLIAALPRWERFAKNHPDCTVYLSPSCEYSERSVIEIKKRVEAIRRLAPSCIPVLSPMRSPTLPGVITEHHGNVTAKPGEIVSTDGLSLFELDAPRWVKKNKQSLITFLWIPPCNLVDLRLSTQPTPDMRNAAISRKDLRTLFDIGTFN